MNSRSPGLLVAALIVLATQPRCAPGPDPTTPATTPPAPAPTPEAAPTPTPAPTPEAAPTLKAAPTPEPPAPVDLATVTAIRFKIVAIPNRKDWVPCGVMHSIGALEVEVLDVGEPPPRMLLLVSCPADMRRVKLAVGETLTATLHRRKQPWPGVRGLPADLPRRQVASFAAPPAAP